MTLEADILSSVAEVCRRAGWVRLAVVFGSHATGKARPGSDFDLAVLPTGSAPLRDELQIASAISAITRAEVDIVRLDHVDPLLGREIARSGVTVFERTAGAFVAWRARAIFRMARLRRNDRAASRALPEATRRGRTVTNVELVTRKLALVDEHVRRLKTRRPAEMGPFRADLLLQDAVALGVLVVVQELVDIALQIASDEGWELAPIEAALALELGDAAQLRNRIAHGYASIDAERIWTGLPGGISSFESFSRAIAKFLEDIKNKAP